MKKFLTVLLVIAVMFTFSFSSAFAADPVSGSTTTHAEAMAQAEKEIVDSFNKNITTAKASLAAEYKETVINANCTIAGSVYAATLDEIAKNFADIVKIAAQQVDKAHATETNAATLKTKILEVTGIKLNLAYQSTSEITVAVNDLAGLDATDLVNYVTVRADQSVPDLQSYYMVFTWTNALSAMKDYLNGEIAKLDMSLYTNDVADKNDPFKTTWAQKAEKAKADLTDAVADTTVNTGMSQTAAYTALQKMYTTVLVNGLAAYKTVDTISGGTVVVSYKLADATIKTKEDLANSDATTSAEKAALKALVQQNAATAYKNALATYNQEVSNAKTAAEKKAAQDKLDAAKEKIDAFSANRIVLIDEDYIKVADARLAYSDSLGKICLDRQEKYEALEKAAAAYKLQVEKDGSLTYVASIIDENLAKAKPIVFNGDAYAEAQLIVGAKNEASNLAWEKEVEVAKLNDAMDAILYAADGSDLYYAPEKAKVEAAYQKMIDKVNATETSEQLKSLNKTVSLAGIDNKATVNGKVAGFLNTTKFMDAVNNYVDYLNIGIAAYADGYREPLTAADKADVAKYLAENGARTNADVAGLFAKAEEYAKAIPTNADKKAEKAAVDELVKALPNVITLADKDAVKAAWEAADKADYMPAKLSTAVALLKAAEEKAIDDMLAALPKTITTADKAAVTALQEAVKAYENEPMFMYEGQNGKLTKPSYKKTETDKAFTDLRAAERAAVEAAIAALPADATAAQVKVARDAVDAFVKDYTDASEPYQAIAKIANLDKLTFLEAQVKAQQITAVESLKIKASSSAKKGSITVKWTVKGDKAAADGYQVYKSTKAQKGYKKAITTKKTSFKNTKNLKKGTRYYYKVRAYKVVDGVKYYSDWSNKANRIAK